MKCIFILISMAFLAAASLPSCKQEKKGNNLICLVDFSTSRDKTTVEWYKKIIKENILRTMGAKDRLIILPIDRNSETVSSEIFTIDFSKYSFDNEYAGLAADQVEAKNLGDSVTVQCAVFDALFETAYLERAAMPAGTNVTAALKIAQKYIVPGQVNTIFVMCDMLQYTNKSKMNFEDHLNTADEIPHYLSVLDKVQLDGANIVVLTGPQPNVRPEKFEVVKKLWEEYFVQCNARLLDYSSGSISIMKQALSQNEH